MKPNKEFCDCGMPEQWAKDPNVPIEYDSETNEYHLVGPPPYNIRHLISYCMDCGEKLPESKRDSFFETPNETEIEELRRLMNEVRNVNDMHNVLGPPDSTFSPSFNNEFHDLYGIRRSKAQYTYSKRWSTITLYISEGEDGSINYVWSPREISARK